MLYAMAIAVYFACVFSGIGKSIENHNDMRQKHSSGNSAEYRSKISRNEAGANDSLYVYMILPY